MIEKLYIYGKGKLQQDFEYIMSDFIVVIGYLENQFDVKKIISEKQELKIIICVRNENFVASQLDMLGLIYGKHYFFARDYFYKLESIYNKSNKRDIYIWGVGNIGEVVYKKIKKYNMPICGYIDSNANEINEFHEYCVTKPEVVLSNSNVYVVVAVYNPDFQKEIEKVLESHNMIFNKDYSLYTDLGTEYDMMYKTYYAYPDKNNRWVCNQPYRYAQIEIDGSIHNCCPDLIYNNSIGNLMKDSFENIWNSYRAKIFRLSIMNGTYALCNHEKCYYLEEYERADDVGYPIISGSSDNNDLRIAVNIDKSCNLFCTSCRNCVQVLNSNEKYNVELLLKKIQNQILKKCDCLIVAGYGEVFFSKYYRKILEEIDYIENINLLTNGNLFDEEFIKQISKKCKSLSLEVSIDAASEKVYSKIRRGGDWKKLLYNLNRISYLKKCGVIKEFAIAFVVQAENFKEMPQFVELGKELNVDYISFTKINNWGTYTEEEFEKITLFEKGNKMKEQLINILGKMDVTEEIILWNNIPVGNKIYKYMFHNVKE